MVEEGWIEIKVINPYGNERLKVLKVCRPEEWCDCDGEQFGRSCSFRPGPRLRSGQRGEGRGTGPVRRASGIAYLLGSRPASEDRS